MANKNVYKFEIIEKVIMARDFETKEEVVELAKKMKDIALANESYSNDVKEAFPLMRKLSDGETYVLLENDLPDLFNE